MAYLVEQPPALLPFVPTPTPSTTVSWPYASFSKELVDLEDKEAYFPVWITQMGCGILVRWQSNP